MSEPPFFPIQPSGLSDQVIAQIRAAIIAGRLKPGDHIVEAALTRQLQVSRTPLREALAILEHEGLVLSFPNRGFFVRTFTEKDVEELFSLRTALENFAGSLTIGYLQPQDFESLSGLIAMQRTALLQGDLEQMRAADMNFHRYLVSLPGHRLLLQSWQVLVAQIAALLCIRAETIDSDESMALDDHARTLQLYREKDRHGLFALNEQINQRVKDECLRALHIWNAQSNYSARVGKVPEF